MEVGPVAHGGHCVAGTRDGGVRAARAAGRAGHRPGHRGRGGVAFLRGDAVAVLRALGRPGGGALPVRGSRRVRRLRLPARRAAGPAGAEGPAWSPSSCAGWPGSTSRSRSRPSPATRTGCAGAPGCSTPSTAHGRRGFRKHRSHDVVPVDDCLITRPDARVLVEGSPVPGTGSDDVVETVAASAGRHELAVAADGFWQVHPGAPGTLVDVVLDVLRPVAGGALPRPLRGGRAVLGLPRRGGGADRTGRRRRGGPGRGRPRAAEPVRRTSPSSSRARWTGRSPSRRPTPVGSVDLVVLDPPREGAKRAVVEQIADPARGRWPTSPATRPPWRATSRSSPSIGYRLAALRAFDLFPMTHHVECVALLTRTGPDLR